MPTNANGESSAGTPPRPPGSLRDVGQVMLHLRMRGEVLESANDHDDDGVAATCEYEVTVSEHLVTRERPTVELHASEIKISLFQRRRRIGQLHVEIDVPTTFAEAGFGRRPGSRCSRSASAARPASRRRTCHDQERVPRAAIARAGSHLRQPVDVVAQLRPQSSAALRLKRWSMRRRRLRCSGGSVHLLYSIYFIGIRTGSPMLAPSARPDDILPTKRRTPGRPRHLPSNSSSSTTSRSVDAAGSVAPSRRMRSHTVSTRYMPTTNPTTPPAPIRSSTGSPPRNSNQDSARRSRCSAPLRPSPRCRGHLGCFRGPGFQASPTAWPKK